MGESVCNATDFTTCGKNRSSAIVGVAMKKDGRASCFIGGHPCTVIFAWSARPVGSHTSRVIHHAPSVRKVPRFVSWNCDRDNIVTHLAPSNLADEVFSHEQDPRPRLIPKKGARSVG